MYEIYIKNTILRTPSELLIFFFIFCNHLYRLYVNLKIKIKLKKKFFFEKINRLELFFETLFLK